jgi:hypothetical protein
MIRFACDSLIHQEHRELYKLARSQRSKILRYMGYETNTERIRTFDDLNHEVSQIEVCLNRFSQLFGTFESNLIKSTQAQEQQAQQAVEPVPQPAQEVEQMQPQAQTELSQEPQPLHAEPTNSLS